MVTRPIRQARSQLRPLTDALNRGSRKSRIRLTAAVCPAGHVLAELFRGAGGELLIVHRVAMPTMRLRDDLGTEEAAKAIRKGERGQLVVTPVGQGRLALGGAGPERVVISRCRCRTAFTIPERLLTDAAAARRKRTVVDI